MSLSTRDALSQFAQSGDEAAFRRVVDELGGLVLRNAYRRSNDQGLAEEITQNVFAIMARKAKRVARHGSIAGWVFTTTRLEAAKALRGRQRHRRKLTALSEELNKVTDMNAEDLEQWRDALPHLEAGLDKLPAADREVLLAKFFENKTYAQIAADSGKSEAACKMRAKRSLDKLNGWMSRRGVTLSVTVLATALGAEWAKAAPAMVAQSITSSAVAAAPAVATGTILTNTLLTMDAIKTAGAAAAAILALGAVPMVVQHSQAKSLRSEVVDLRQQVEQVSGSGVAGEPAAVTGRVQQQALTPAQRFLANARMPEDAEQFVDRLVMAMMQQDMASIIKALIPLGGLTPDELDQLIADVKALEGNPGGQQIALPLLMSMAAKDGRDPGIALDEALADGINIQPLVGEIVGWAQKDPQAALAWYRKALNEGALDGKGTENSAQEVILRGLMMGMASVDPATARGLLDEVDGRSREDLQSVLLGNTIFGDDAGRQIARELLAEYAHPQQRLRALEQAINYSGGAGKSLDEAADIIADYEFSGADYSSLVGAIASGRHDLPFEERANWVAAQIKEGPVDGVATFIRNQSSGLGGNSEDITAWVDGLESGPARDAALAAEADRSMVFERNYEPQALLRVDLISDPVVRADAVERVLTRWMGRDREAALAEAERRGIDLSGDRGER